MTAPSRRPGAEPVTRVRAHWPKICRRWKPLGLYEPSDELRAYSPGFISPEWLAPTQTAGPGQIDRHGSLTHARTHARTKHASMHVPARARTHRRTHRGHARQALVPGCRRGPGLAWGPTVKEALRTRAQTRMPGGRRGAGPRRGGRSWPRPGGGARRRPGFAAGIFVSWILQEAVEMLLERGGRCEAALSPPDSARPLYHSPPPLPPFFAPSLPPLLPSSHFPSTPFQSEEREREGVRVRVCR